MRITVSSFLDSNGTSLETFISIVQLQTHIVEVHRDKVAIFCEDENGHRSKWIFERLQKSSDQTARIMDEYGIIKEDRVGVCLGPRPETVAVLG